MWDEGKESGIPMQYYARLARNSRPAVCCGTLRPVCGKRNFRQGNGRKGAAVVKRSTRWKLQSRIPQKHCCKTKKRSTA